MWGATRHGDGDDGEDVDENDGRIYGGCGVGGAFQCHHGGGGAGHAGHGHHVLREIKRGQLSKWLNLSGHKYDWVIGHRPQDARDKKRDHRETLEKAQAMVAEQGGGDQQVQPEPRIYLS
jgi:hypothetical protein